MKFALCSAGGNEIPYIWQNALKFLYTAMSQAINKISLRRAWMRIAVEAL